MGHADAEAAVAAVRDGHPPRSASSPAIAARGRGGARLRRVARPRHAAEGERARGHRDAPLPARRAAVRRLRRRRGRSPREQLGYYLRDAAAHGLRRPSWSEALRGAPVRLACRRPASTRPTPAITCSSRAPTGRPTLARRVAGAYGGGTLLVRGLGVLLRGDDGASGLPRRSRGHVSCGSTTRSWRACRVVIDAEVAHGPHDVRRGGGAAWRGRRTWTVASPSSRCAGTSRARASR